MRFHAVIRLNGKTATGIEVPPDVLQELGPSKHPKVRVTIGGFSYPSSVAAMGGRYLIPVSAEVRAQARVAAGDEVEVDIVPDTQPRTVTVPSDLAAALEGHSGARRAFDQLSYTGQRRYVLAIEDAKTARTRQHRIDKAVVELAVGVPER